MRIIDRFRLRPFLQVFFIGFSGPYVVINCHSYSMVMGAFWQLAIPVFRRF